MSSLRWFRRLLKLLPAEFQADYARDMERTFHAQLREAALAGERGLLRLWIETLAGLARTAPREHFDQLRQDTRYAWRTLRRRPAFAAIVVAVLGLGIGATTGVFSLLDAAVLRPLPFAGADHLVSIRERPRQEPQAWEVSWPLFTEFRAQARSFEAIGAFMLDDAVVSGQGEPVRVGVARVTANLFTVLAAGPAVGRAFLEVEDRPGGAPVAMVSAPMATRMFGDPERALGRSVVLDGEPRTVVGVMPPSFRFPDAERDVWLPYGELADESWMQRRAVHVALPVGRLRNGVEPAAAARELNAIAASAQQREPGSDPDHEVIVRRLDGEVAQAGRDALLALFGAVVAMLLVAWSNLALLLLNRANARARELSLRGALGAGTVRLLRQLLTEAFLLGVAGTAVGLVLAFAFIEWLLPAAELPLSSLRTPSLTGWTLACAAAACLGSVGVLAAIPSWQALRWSGVPLVQAAPTVAAPGRRPADIFVGIQVALSCVLVLLTSLLGRSVVTLMTIDPGFVSERLLLVRSELPATAYPDGASAVRFYSEARAAIAALPGVLRVSGASAPPLSGGSSAGMLTVEGQSFPPGAEPTTTYRRVMPGYFRTAGVPVLAGREFDERDGTGEAVVIVDAALARRFFPAGDAVGRRIKVGPPDDEPWLRIVGIVGDVRGVALDTEPPLTTYEPHTQRPSRSAWLLARTAGDPGALASSVNAVLRSREPELLISAVESMDERLAASTAGRWLQLGLIGGFAAFALLLSALGLYGALAWQVTTRAREIGVRAALGAGRAAIARTVIRQGLVPTMAGLAGGLLLAVVTADAARHLLFGVSPYDAWALTVTPAVLLAVALAATALPAWRATRVDPSVTLRTE